MEKAWRDVEKNEVKKLDGKLNGEDTIIEMLGGRVPGGAFRNRFALADIGCLMAQMIAITNEHKIEDPAKILIPLTLKHLGRKNGLEEVLLEGFNIGGIEAVREGGAVTKFRMPVMRNNIPVWWLCFEPATIKDPPEVPDLGVNITTEPFGEAEDNKAREPLKTQPYQDFMRQGNGGVMPLGDDPLSANTSRDLHLKRLWDPEGNSGGKELDNLDKYFSRVPRSYKNIPDLGSGLLSKRLAHPLRDKRMIERSQEGIRAIADMPGEDREDLYKHLDLFYKYFDDFTYSWFHSDGGRNRDQYRKSLFFLSKIADELEAVRGILNAKGRKGKFVLPEKIEKLLKDKNFSKVREYFANYPLGEDDMPGRDLDWLHESARALREGWGRTDHERYFWRGIPLTPFWQGITGYDERDRKGEFTPAVMRRIEEFEKLEEALKKEPNERIGNLPRRITENMNELLFALGGANMIEEGHYSIPEGTDGSGIIHLEKAWNPVAGTYDRTDKLDIDLGADSNFLGLTGPNEVGKSTAIEMTALCVLYYQMGLPIPAQAGKIGIFRNIYTAVPGYETLEPGESQHTGLIKRLTEIIKIAGPRDLVLIDEAHMGSDYKDLTALTTVLMEDLVATGATVLYATHLKSAMRRIAQSDPRINPKQIVLVDDEDGIAHRVMLPGIAERSLSIRTLESLDYPPEVLKWTEEYYDAILSGTPVPGTAERPVITKRKQKPVRKKEDDRGEAIAMEAAKALFPQKNFYYELELVAYRFAREDIIKWDSVPGAIDLKKALFKRPVIRKYEPEKFDDIAVCVAALDRMNNSVVNNLKRKAAMLKKIRKEGLMDHTKPDDMKSMVEFLHKSVERFKGFDFADSFKVYGWVEDPETGRRMDRVPVNTPREIRKHYRQSVRQLKHEYDTLMGSFSLPELRRLDYLSGIAESMRENDLHFVEHLGEGETFSVKNARSPFIPRDKVVALDLEGDSAHPEFIITGPNKSGKTMSIRTLESLVYLARLDLPVPALMRIPKYDKMLTFFGGKEDMAGGDSYFRDVAERLNSILNQATSGSLVIMDELHGSDYWELSALQAAVIKYLDAIGATVILVTHMREGLGMAREIKSVKFLKTGVRQISDGSLKYDYSISEDPYLEAKSFGVESVKGLLTAKQYNRVLSIRASMEREEGKKAPAGPASGRNNPDEFVRSESARAADLRDALNYVIGKEMAETSGIVALGTGWIKGYGKGLLQHDGLNPLITSLKGFCEDRMIPFVVGEDDELPALIEAEKERRGMPENAKGIILAGVSRDGDMSVAVRELLGNKDHTVVGIDGRELTTDSYIRILEMLTIALNISIGIKPSLDNASMDIFPPDENHPIYILTPHALPMNYFELKAVYEAQKFA
ncbi:MAG: hypothetical protein HQL30_03000 [Candidatus Omnitrophica bacterium]|nr:hypothetical protein [Candidatus Omnitrophota bacterium]